VGIHMGGSEIFDMVQHFKSDTDVLGNGLPRDITIVALPQVTDMDAMKDAFQTTLLGVWRGCHSAIEDRNVLGSEIMAIREFLITQGFPQQKLVWWLDMVWHTFDSTGAPVSRNSLQYNQAGRQRLGQRKRELVIKFYLAGQIGKGVLHQTLKNFRTHMGNRYKFGHRGFRMEFFTDYTNMYITAAHSAWVDTAHCTTLTGVRDHLFAEEFLDILGRDTRNLNIISNAGCIVYSNESELWVKGGNRMTIVAKLHIFWDRADTQEPETTVSQLDVDHWTVTVKPLQQFYTGNVVGGIQTRLHDSRSDFLSVGELYRRNTQAVRSPQVQAKGSPSGSPAAKKSRRASTTPTAMTIHTPQSSASTSSVSSSLTKRFQEARWRFQEARLQIHS